MAIALEVVALDHTAPGYKHLSPLTPHIQHTSLTPELTLLVCNGDVLATAQPKRVFCCVTGWRVVRPHTRTQNLSRRKNCHPYPPWGYDAGAADTVSRPPPTSTHAQGVAQVSFRTTYIQQKTKATVLSVIQAPRWATSDYAPRFEAVGTPEAAGVT